MNFKLLFVVLFEINFLNEVLLQVCLKLGGIELEALLEISLAYRQSELL